VALIEIRDLYKSFGDVVAVDGVSLDIDSGEFLTLLGPSGSGKTTVLRMIAGFERPDRGTISLNGKNITDLPPYERDVNTVFQDYALFPHMDVISNIEYGLRVKKVPKEERREKSLQALAQVRLSGYENRKPHQLSGGQRQRVALARALVNRPSVLLLDEPLGALDLKLREQMQIELKELQREVGITFVFVTHDQEEALTMSDRIAAFNNGKIEQLGTPRDIYESPKSSFVADFVGKNNKVDIDGRRLSIRPEYVSISSSKPSSERVYSGTLRDIIFVGANTRFLVDSPLGLVTGLRGEEKLSVGDSVWIYWDKNKEFSEPQR
jgi:putative spermidine/putrescine transport system ATP-binding protein